MSTNFGKKSWIVLLFFWYVVGHAQVSNTGIMDTVSGVKIDKLSLSAYIDAYYGSASKKTSEKYIPYMVSSNRAGEFNINLAYIDLRYTDHNFRARFAPGVGTYMNTNYAAEQGTLKNVVEASAGFKLSKTKEIWLDGGVIGSPYTNESAFSKDHLMYTRSLAPEYVPYYLSGIKLSIPLSRKFMFYAYLLNGWQQIQDVNNKKSLGTQVEYRPNDRNLFNWNTYIGDERSTISPTFRMRYFTDFYWIYNPDGKFSMTSCAYLGNQKTVLQDRKKDNYWWQANLIGRYRFNQVWSLSGRFEYFNDPSNIQLVNLGDVTDKFKIWSAGLCLNVKVREGAMLRFEGRHFGSKDKIFPNEDGVNRNNNTWLVSNMTVWF